MSCCRVSGVRQQLDLPKFIVKGIVDDPAVQFFVLCLSGLVLNPDPESDSEDSEPDGPDDPVIPSPEMDDVKGEGVPSTGKEIKHRQQNLS